MNKGTLICRVLLGLVFFVFGLNGFLNFMPPPPTMPEKQQLFFNGMMAAGYFFPFVKLTETVCGLLLLINKLVPLALVVLAPIILNILGVNIFLAPSGLPIAAVVVVLEIYLAFFSPYSPKIKALFKQN